MTDHAGLIAQLRKEIQWQTEGSAEEDLMSRAADALAALGDTVPREWHDQVRRLAEAGVRLARTRTVERDEARAERDALAAARDQAPHSPTCRGVFHPMVAIDASPCTCYKSTAPAVSLALHDADVKAQALDEAAEAFATGEWSDAFMAGGVDDEVSAVQATEAWFKARAAVIREGAK